jgi:hypothetical protein
LIHGNHWPIVGQEGTLFTRRSVGNWLYAYPQFE